MKSKRVTFIFLAMLVIFAMLLGACTTNNAPNTEQVEEANAVENAANAEEPESEPAEEPVEAESAYPVTIENCGREFTIEAAPQHAVSMNQSATEVMLALGLEEYMVGTAYIDDAILPEFETAYNSIPILSETYPSPEVLFATEPDFIYGGFASAFGDDNAGPQDELAELGIASYVSPSYCIDETYRPTQSTIETTYKEIRDIAAIFGVSERAEALIADMQATLDEVQAAIADIDETPSVFWFDSGDPPFVGACCGGPGMVMDLAGAVNIFEDAPGNFATVSWEEVLDRDPDAIVINDASWSPAADKIELLKTNPAYADMTAVQEERFIIIPFSYTILGVRNADAVEILAQGLYPEIFGEAEADAGIEAESTYPVTIENCGREFTIEAAPQHAVSMNQSATEVMLALGLEEYMVGTAYIDDAILPEFETAYNSIPIPIRNLPIPPKSCSPPNQTSSMAVSPAHSATTMQAPKTNWPNSASPPMFLRPTVSMKPTAPPNPPSKLPTKKSATSPPSSVFPSAQRP